jgi:hypothetical protein
MNGMAAPASSSRRAMAAHINAVRGQWPARSMWVEVTIWLIFAASGTAASSAIISASAPRASA